MKQRNPPQWTATGLKRMVSATKPSLKDTVQIPKPFCIPSGTITNPVATLEGFAMPEILVVARPKIAYRDKRLTSLEIANQSIV